MPFDNAGRSSPLSKRLPNPLAPSPHRTTSQLSTVSVTVESPSRNAKMASTSTDASSVDDRGRLISPIMRRTLSTGATAGSSRASSLYGLDAPTDASPSGSKTPGGSSASSRKGKERVLEDTGVDEVDVTGEMVTSSGNAAKGLRELVRRSTVGEEVRWTGRSGVEPVKEEVQLDPPPDQVHTPRRYHVLTNAGKPVFRSQAYSLLDMYELKLAEVTTIRQKTISPISWVSPKPLLASSQTIKIGCECRYIIKGHYRIAFLLKAPLYLFCVSDWGEPEHVLRVHLEYIHLQILSVVSSAQLSGVFQRRSNFDLSRLLEGTESFLHNLIARCQYDFSYLTSTLQPLRMAPALRDTAAAALMPPARFKDLLYVLLIAGGHIVTLLRPRKHSIHPSDLHLLLNTLASSSTLRSSESWLPICFPKFNPAGFVHAYVSYVLEDVGLVFVSADREAFEQLRGWKQIVLEKLEKDKTLAKIQASIPLHPYSVSAIQCPGLRHFIYKSRQNVQITAPTWEAPYDEDNDNRQRLVVMYQLLHDTVHARSGQSSPLKLVYMKTEQEACLAWVTKPFELYLAVSPHLTKSAIVAAANSIARWVAGEEGKVFLRDAPVF